MNILVLFTKHNHRLHVRFSGTSHVVCSESFVIRKGINQSSDEGIMRDRLLDKSCHPPSLLSSPPTDMEIT